MLPALHADLLRVWSFRKTWAACAHWLVTRRLWMLCRPSLMAGDGGGHMAGGSQVPITCLVHRAQDAIYLDGREMEPYRGAGFQA